MVAAVVGLFTPVSFFVYEGDQFANLSVLLRNAMTLDTHVKCVSWRFSRAPSVMAFRKGTTAE